jgi:glycosyltransferase involved in cell wall biosynthesis
MMITVIVCTYNRCASLSKALESLSASVVPDGVEWEILVVDNNSSDRTSAIVEDFCEKFPRRFRYLFEPHQGKSHALNSGIRDARGEILAFVDDDVSVEPAWLHNLTSVLRGGAWVGSGGRILPPKFFLLPRWLSLDPPYAMGGALCAHFDLGDKELQLDRPPYGTNMAFNKEVFAKYGDFRIDMGPCPGSELRSEDTEFGSRLLAAEERLLYVPSAVVYHEVAESRVRKEFFLAWWYDFGRARILEVGVRPKIWGISRHYLSLPNNILKVLPSKALRWLFSLNPQQRFFNKCMTWSTVGRIVEIWRQSRQPTEAYKMQSARGAMR